MSSDNFNVATSVLEALETQDASYLQQSLSATTIEACVRATSQLKVLKLNGQERNVINQISNLDAAEGFVSMYVAKYKETGLAKRGWKKANFSPECSVALGLVGLLLIQPLNNKSEIEERLETEMRQLEDVLNQARFSQSMMDSAQIGIEVDGLCAAVIDFLSHALHYQKKSSLVKVLSAILLDYSRRFQSFIDKIRHHAAKIERLAQQSYTTVLMDTKDLLNHTASTTDEFRRWAIAHAANFNCRVARLEASVHNFQSSITEVRTYEALKNVYEIEALLLPTGPRSCFSASQVRDRFQHLAPKEQWHNFAPEIQFPDWARMAKPPVLWIGGTINGRGSCWVSALALDIIEALETERSVDTVYSLCDNSDNNEALSPLIIFNTAVMQLLIAQPEVVFQRSFMDLLPPRLFQEARSSTSASFTALINLIKICGEQSLSDDREIFFIIDRIDLCSALASKSEGKRFLLALQKLNQAMPQLRIIITSSTPAPKLPALETGQQDLEEVWVDPHKPIAMRSR